MVDLDWNVNDLVNQIVVCIFKIKNKDSLPEFVLGLNWRLTRHVLEARGTESFETADLTVAVEDLSRLCAVFAFSCPCRPPTVYPGTDIFLEEKTP